MCFIKTSYCQSECFGDPKPAMHDVACLSSSASTLEPAGEPSTSQTSQPFVLGRFSTGLCQESLISTSLGDVAPGSKVMLNPN